MATHLVSRLAAVALGAAVASPLAAQSVVTTIRQSSTMATVNGPVPYMRGIALHPDGSAVVALLENDGSGTIQGNQLDLYRSTDDGGSWNLLASAPTSEDGRGAITTSGSCDELHVAWYARNGTPYHNAYHQALDLRTGQWIGTPAVLATGTGSNDQFYPRDVLVTDAGTIVVSVQAHRAPSLGLGGWCGFLMVKRPQDAAFQGPFQVNNDATGISMDMVAIGERIHMSFRTASGSYGLRYREFDAASLTFPAGNDLQIDSLINNQNTIAADTSGNLYVLYGVGDSSGAAGEIRLAYAQAGNYASWATQTVLADPDMTNGNVAYNSYSLARGPGDLMFAVYSKRAVGPRLQDLYWRLFQSGNPIGPEIQAAAGTAPDTFVNVCGHRSWRVESNPWVVTHGRPSQSSGGLVQLVRLGTAEHTVQWGQGCAGNLAAGPRIRATSPPTGGTTFGLRIEQTPGNALVIAFLGAQCQRPPLSLAGFGMPGCVASHDALATVGLSANAAGIANLSLMLPQNPPYAGTPFQFSALVFAPGANSGGALTTDSLLTWIR